MTEIILGSASPRRKQLLEMAEIPCRVMIPDTDENFPSSLSPAKAAEFVAHSKAKVIAGSRGYQSEGNGSMILTADTMVVLDGWILGKPVDRYEAVSMLSKLSGREHQVVTGVCLMHPSKTSIFHETTIVRFKSLQPSVISHYVDRYTPFDKAGAYAIQEWIGLVGINSIEGDYYNVMGLPISRIITELDAFFLR